MNSVETVKETEGNIIEIKGLEKHFRSGGNDVKAVDGVTIGFPRAKMIALRGSSGSGKTTLLNLIGALDGRQPGLLLLMAWMFPKRTATPKLNTGCRKWVLSFRHIV